MFDGSSGSEPGGPSLVAPQAQRSMFLSPPPPIAANHTGAVFPQSGFVHIGGKRSRDDDSAMEEEDYQDSFQPDCSNRKDSFPGFSVPHAPSSHFRRQAARDVRRRFDTGDENAGAGVFNSMGIGMGMGSTSASNPSAHNVRDASSSTPPSLHAETNVAFTSCVPTNPTPGSSTFGAALADAARGKRYRPSGGEGELADKGMSWPSETTVQRSLVEKDSQLAQLQVEHSAAVQACEELRASETRLGEENKLLKRAVGILESRLREAAAQGAQASERVRALEARQVEVEAVLQQAADYVSRLEAELVAARRAPPRPQQQQQRFPSDEDEGGGYFGGYTPDQPPPDVY